MNTSDNIESYAVLQLPSDMQLPTVDVKYLYRFEQTISMLEKGLHCDDDPKNVALGSLLVARDFYDGDWCGLLVADLDAGVFYPYWWTDKAEGDMAPTEFDEFEFVGNYDHWEKALRENSYIIVPDIDQAKHLITPNEFAHYQKLSVRSVIGVPLYYHRPCGFLVVRNPTRYFDHPEMLAIMGYVVLNCWKEQRNIEALQYQMKIPCAELTAPQDVYIRMFGEPEIHTLQGQLSAETLNSPKCWRLLVYLALHKKPIAMRAIAEALSPNEDVERTMNTLRVNLSRMKQRLETILDPEHPFVANTPYGYRLDPYYNVTTDADEFETIIENALQLQDVYPRSAELKRGLDLYRGSLYAEASSEHWLLPSVEHYTLIYLRAVNQLLKDLVELKDYPGIQKYAANSLRLEPGNETALFWLIVSLVKMGSHQMARAELERAKTVLTEIGYAELQEKLAKFDKGIIYHQRPNLKKWGAVIF